MNPPPSAPFISANPGGTAPFDRDRLPPGADLPAKGDPEQVGVYRIVGRITRDAAGTVLLGVDGDGAPAVLRLVPAELADAPDVRSRLGAEVGRLVRARALCTAAYRGADVRAVEPWLAAAYVPGRTLAAHVAEHGPLTAGMLTALAAGLAESLAAGHAVGATHLALDPTKVVLSPEGPKVVDLGIARATGKSMAAPGWAAPEQSGATGTDGAGTGSTVTGYADVFAWGSLVRFAATGWEPSGAAVDEPELGAVPPHLAPLVRRALATDPEQRPTALELLQELTEGTGEEPAEAVSAVLAAEWTGVTVPEPRRVSRARRPALLAGTGAVLVAALIGGWAVLRPGADPDRADTTAGEDAVAEEAVEEEPVGPAVAETPEDVEAVVTQAVELALGASSFAAYDHRYNNDVGDTTPTHYLYTEVPEPALSQATYLGPVGGGVLQLGTDPGEAVYFSDGPGAQVGEFGRDYYEDPGSNYHANGQPRAEWEDLVRGVEVLLDQETEVTYEGRGAVPEDRLFEAAPDEEETAAVEQGHHYTGTFVGDIATPGDWGPGEVEFDLWLSDGGYPLLFVQVSETDGPLDHSDEFLTLTHYVGFSHFDQPVEVEIPEESEIHPERP